MDITGNQWKNKSGDRNGTVTLRVIIQSSPPPWDEATSDGRKVVVFSFFRDVHRRKLTWRYDDDKAIGITM